MLQRQSPPRQYAIVGNDDLSVVANRPAEDLARELAPHPCASKQARHHQQDYPCLSSPAVEDVFHGGMIPQAHGQPNWLVSDLSKNRLQRHSLNRWEQMTVALPHLIRLMARPGVDHSLIDALACAIRDE